MTVKTFVRVILVYFAIAAAILYTANFSLIEFDLPISLSILLLIPLHIWHRNHCKTS